MDGSSTAQSSHVSLPIAGPERDRTVSWREGRVRFIDQTRLPSEEVWLETTDERALGDAIRSMRIRGAPAIGAAAAYGLALAANASTAQSVVDLLQDLKAAAARLRSTRPTAVNLFWAIDRVLAAASHHGTPGSIRGAVLNEAEQIAEEDVAACRAMGRLGAELLADQSTILTHCNAGALATVGYGTALGVVRAGFSAGRVRRVFVDETRPLLQGARLTAWELGRDGIPLTLIADTMAGYYMRRGDVTCVIVGADRIAANGDVANKIGTYQVAVLAHENGIPFYVAAPTSTIDCSLADGSGIPIEERRQSEVTHFSGHLVAPEGTEAGNPAFDVTPQRYVTAIITEIAVIRAPFGPGLTAAVREAERRRDVAGSVRAVRTGEQ